MTREKRQASTELEAQGRVTIPKPLRDALGLVPGSRLAVALRGREIVVYPLSDSRPLRELRGALGKGESPLSTTDIDARVRKGMRLERLKSGSG
jgi:AbrB family looped-hinge helix DNA binding protein